VFGDLTGKWVTEPGDEPKRNLTDACAIAEVVSRFDVCAIQETRRDLTALQTVIRILGDDWAYVVTDVTEGGPGNGERLAFVHDRRRARSSGLVGEIVLPANAKGILDGALDRQFARTPYAVSFAAGAQAFTLVTLHALYGETMVKKERRRHELQAIAQWLADRADDPDAFNRNLITLGDFNIDRQGDPLWQAFASTGLAAPAELQDVPRNITFADGGPKKHYDQIAWFTKGARAALTLDYTTAGYVDWTDYILEDARDDDDRKAHISDHYPLWAEFAR
jgi:exonuclease III